MSLVFLKWHGVMLYAGCPALFQFFGKKFRTVGQLKKKVGIK